MHIYILPQCSTTAASVLNSAGMDAQFERSCCAISRGILNNINVPTNITAENAYDFVLALAEKNQHAIPFYLLLDIAPNSDFPLFSIYSYENMGNSGLFCVHTYDFCKEYVVQSKYIANAQNFKDWAPNLWLSSDSGFSQKAKRVYAGALLDIKANAETAIAFPLAYCGSVVYTNSGFIYTVE